MEKPVAAANVSDAAERLIRDANRQGVAPRAAARGAASVGPAESGAGQAGDDTSDTDDEQDVRRCRECGSIPSYCHCVNAAPLPVPAPAPLPVRPRTAPEPDVGSFELSREEALALVNYLSRALGEENHEDTGEVPPAYAPQRVGIRRGTSRGSRERSLGDPRSVLTEPVINPRPAQAGRKADGPRNVTNPSGVRPQPRGQLCPLPHQRPSMDSLLRRDMSKST